MKQFKAEFDKLLRPMSKDPKETVSLLQNSVVFKRNSQKPASGNTQIKRLLENETNNIGNNMNYVRRSLLILLILSTVLPHLWWLLIEKKFLPFF